jgi:hypothetical protein
VEHFSPPDALLGRLAGMLAPRGVLVTLVPNFTGRWGRWQRRVDRPVYDTHVNYAPADLDRVHHDAGFTALEPARFFGGFAPLVVNAGRALSDLPRPVALAATAVTWGVQQTVAWSTHVLPLAEDSQGRSGYICGVYRLASPGQAL